MREQPVSPCVSLPVLRAGNVPALTLSDGFLKISHALDAIISDDSNRKFQKETHLILVVSSRWWTRCRYYYFARGCFHPYCILPSPFLFA